MKKLRNIAGLFFIILISCQPQTKKWNDWIQKNSYGINLSDTNNYEDLEFLTKILTDKRIVFLGESGHGVAEYTLLKSRIIRYLHETMDFDILAFESNAADGFAADYYNSYTNVDSSIYNSISTLWQVKEIVPLFEYINATHSTDDPLIVQGVDITQSNGSYAFSKFLFNLIYPIDPLYAAQIKYKDSIFSAQGVKKWTLGCANESERQFFRTLKKERLEDYNELIEYFETNKLHFSNFANREVEAALFYLQSRIDFIHWSSRDSAYMVKVTEGTIYEGVSLQKLFSVYRDYLMAQNLYFLANNLFPDKKIIVWAQNAHIKKWPLRMSYELNKKFPTYSISLYCYSGWGDRTFGQGFDGTNPDSMVYEFITPTDPLSVAQLLHASGHDITFVDMQDQIENVGNSWMFNVAKTHDWDGSYLPVLDSIRSVWDGLILINNTTTPEYLEFEYDYLDKKIKGYN